MSRDPNRKLRVFRLVETALSTTGLVATSIMLAVIVNRNDISDSIFDAFRGGNLAAILVGIGLLAGIAAIPLFITNLLMANRKFILLRSILLSGMLMMLAAMGSFV